MKDGVMTSVQSRPRRSAANSSSQALPADERADPEYLALSAKQRRAIDRAFARGLKAVEGRGKKKRKLDQGVQVDSVTADAHGDVGGGFMTVDDGAEGGFMLDGDEEDGAGGFLPDDGGGGFMPDDDEEAGGFMPEEPEAGPSRTSTRPPSIAPTPLRANSKIPLYILPGLLASLGLPSDEDVLSVFRASASGWDEEEQVPARRKGKDEDVPEGGVELKDFRAVCAALMPAEEEGEGGSQDDVMEEVDDEDDEDAFQSPEEDESDLSSLSGSEYGGADKSTGRSSRKVKSTGFAEDDEGITSKSKTTRRTRGKKGLVKDDQGRVRLSARQKELAKDVWDMLKPPAPAGTQGAKQARGSDILSREEVKKWVRTLGEMWTEDEITDMVTLFSSQHEGRGLTFEDFGGVMLRAGLV
ncbi:hypothetical protein IAU60_001732 [Kwoniella sp. DSM 27419]